ncbi:MAG: hypothetical protein ACFFCW_35575 [Candidatus Hodarchaeota archaeon]
MEFEQWSRRSLLLVGLSCIVFGVAGLTVISFTKPWIKRPQIVGVGTKRSLETIQREGETTVPGVVEKGKMEESPLEGDTPGEERATVSKSLEPSMVIPKRGIKEKVVIIGGTEEGKKTPAAERRYRDTVLEKEIAGGEIKIKKKIPTTISVREGPSASEIRKKSVKEIPQSHVIAPDTVELERETSSVEGSEPEEKPGGFTFTEEKRAERVEVKIANKGVIEDERATSPVETSSPLIKYETAITAQKTGRQRNKPDRGDDVKGSSTAKAYGAPSDLKGKTISVARLPVDSNSPTEPEERIVRAKPPSLIATEEEVKQFFGDYIERYTQKDIDGFLFLFSSQAVQNQRDGFDKIKKIYSDFFEKSKQLRYRIEDPRIEIYQNTVEVTGRYKLIQKGKEGKKERVWKGKIRWILVRENGALKIRYLDYRHDKLS